MDRFGCNSDYHFAVVASLDGRRFRLVRSADPSGVSGVGTVAYGATFPDGKTVMWWNTDWHTIGIYASPAELIEIHGHDGATTIEWIDE